MIDDSFHSVTHMEPDLLHHIGGIGLISEANNAAIFLLMKLLKSPRTTKVSVDI